jgi:tetratricopeptide (TPR) repeat protein
LLANVYTQKGDAPRAIPILKKLLELDPNDSRSAQQLKGLETSPPATPISKISGKPVYRPADSPVVQESKAQMAFSTTSAPAVKTETLAELYRSQGHVQQALDVYRELARKEPGNPNYLEKISEIEKEVEIEQKGGLAAQGQRVANLRALLSKIQERRRAM